jgi:hypothetical protein
MTRQNFWMVAALGAALASATTGSAAPPSVKSNLPAGVIPVTALRALPAPVLPRPEPPALLVRSNTTDLGANASWPVAQTIRAVVGGGMADYGLHKVFFPLDARGRNPLTITAPDGRTLACRATFLALHDLASDQHFLLAEVTNRIGLIVGADQVVYTNAFDTLKADLRYRYTKYSLEQDIILHEHPALPKGFSPETTRLEVWSEWFDSPPQATVRQGLNLRAGDAVAELAAPSIMEDESVDFGAMKIGAGHAFSATAQNAKTPVGKSWLCIANQDWLVEAVDYLAVKSKLDLLPAAPRNASQARPKSKREELIRTLARGNDAPPATGRMLMAQARRAPQSEFVMDFVIVCSVPVPAGCISWWPGGNSATDAITTSGNNATWSGTAGYGAGKAGQGFSLTGANYLQVANATSLNPTAGLTVEGWIRITQNPNWRTLVFKGSEDPWQVCYLLALSADNRLNAMVNDSEELPGTVILPNDTWCHVAMTYDAGSTNLALYVNGQLDVAGVVSGGLAANSAPVMIGNGAGLLRFVGSVDEPAIYNRALGASEIQALYDAGTAGRVNPDCVAAPTNLVAWWAGDGNVYDLARTNFATLANGATYAAAAVGSGFSFDGEDDGVTAWVDSALNLGANDNLTIEAWVQPQANTNDYNVMSVVGKRDADGWPVVGYELFLADGAPGFQIADSSGYASFVATNDLRGGYHHLAVTLDRSSTNGGHIYVDGIPVLEFDPTVVSGSLSNAEPVRIGVHPTGGFDGYYKGVIDEVSIYRRALSGSEITALYSSGSAGKCKTDSDHDGLTDLQEALLGTNPNDTDSDYDGRSDGQEQFEDATIPTCAGSVSNVLLGRWTFDQTNSWAGEQGQAPLSAAYIWGTPSARSNAVVIYHTNGAYLKYRDVEADGQANFNCQRGTVRYWFKPAWSSASAGGAGPQTGGPLFSLGNWTPGAIYGWWGISVGSGGNNLSFHTQGTGEGGVGTVHGAPAISWQSNTWHQVAVTYSGSGTKMYLDGVLAATGVGITNYPNAANRAGGFTLAWPGAQQCEGQFEDLETYNYELGAVEILANYSESPLADQTEEWPIGLVEQPFKIYIQQPK